MTPPVEETTTDAEVTGESDTSGDEAEGTASATEASGDPVTPVE
jgi:hypothetical protein